IPIYQIDAFTSEVFRGNPAAVCLLDKWLEDDVLQSIAAENNLAETAFIIKKGREYDLRWFTPSVEIDLCGHATLASAFVIFKYLEPELNYISFSTMSGELTVSMDPSGKLSMDFPARVPTKTTTNEIIEQAFGISPKEVWESEDLMLLFESESEIRNLQPNIHKISEITDYFAVIVTAPGDNVDFVSRFFAPNAGIPEDPVTGRAHCTLVPFWSKRLNKPELHAIQLSERTGELFCEDKGERVLMSGYAALFLKGQIYL
ncbi:MAG: PhzF family phenazine biosynthesis protein, partial [Cocleimonas sp.]